MVKTVRTVLLEDSRVGHVRTKKRTNQSFVSDGRGPRVQVVEIEPPYTSAREEEEESEH